MPRLTPKKLAKKAAKAPAKKAKVEPTPEMIEAAYDEYAAMWPELWEQDPRGCVQRLLRRGLEAAALSKAFGQPSSHMKRADVRSASSCHVEKFVVAAKAIESPNVECGPVELRHASAKRPAR